MKSLRFMLSVGLMSLSTVAFAQSDAQKSVAQSDTHAYKAVDTPAPNSDAQKSFDTMKTLAGIWTAKLTLDPPLPDINGGTQRGHMHHAVFTVIDANHHTEDWTYMMPGDKPMHAHFDLQRAK